MVVLIRAFSFFLSFCLAVDFYCFLLYNDVLIFKSKALTMNEACSIVKTASESIKTQFFRKEEVKEMLFRHLKEFSFDLYLQNKAPQTFNFLKRTGAKRNVLAYNVQHHFEHISHYFKELLIFREIDLNQEFQNLVTTSIFSKKDYGDDEAEEGSITPNQLDEIVNEVLYEHTLPAILNDMNIHLDQCCQEDHDHSSRYCGA